MAERSFGERLAQARRLLSVERWADVTQADVGAMVGKSGATISRYEAGALDAPLAVRIALESLLPFPAASADDRQPAAPRPFLPVTKPNAKKPPSTRKKA